MHRLTSSFVLGYHGCDRQVGEQLLARTQFVPSANDYDWLGPGVYFWEANPHRAFEFARETEARRGSDVRDPFAIGAVVELGLCLDLTTSAGLDQLKRAHENLVEINRAANLTMPVNSGDQLRRKLDCAVIRRFHSILELEGQAPIDTVKGIFTEGALLYPGSGFREKTHTQICVRNLDCIKGIFRVPAHVLRR